MVEILRRNKNLIITIVVVLLLLVGGSFAYLRLTMNATKENIIKAGNLELILDDTASNGILLTNVIPITDAKGLETDVYTFTLENKGTMTADYTIYLDDLPIDEGKTRMADKYVKYSLTKNGGEATTELLTTIGENPNRILDSGTIKGNTTNTYTLRIWMDKDADNDAMGTVFNAQLRVETLQVGDTKGPTLTIGNVEATTNTITIAYTAEDASGVKEYICEYGTTEDLGSKGETTESKCTITGLNSNTTYYYKITAIDNKLNETSKTGNTKTEKDVNSNIVAAYTYNKSSCVTGEESGCVPTTCYTNSASGSCPAGTIIKYKVNSSTTKYFHVLHDDGSTITMQQRENTINSTSWYSSSSTNIYGPKTILSSLESATGGWINVNNQTYTMGTTNFNGTNAYTGCSGYTASSCSTNTYTLGQRTGKARMITIQETSVLGCTTSDKSCPNWMNNYLEDSTSYGGTVDDTNEGNIGYWTMSASSSTTYAWDVSRRGGVYNTGTMGNRNGARAVVVINKYN